MNDYNLLIIGAGPAGLAAAKRSAKYGAKVAIVERDHFGGVCVNQGCIPKKLMVYAADFAQDAEGYGWHMGDRRFDWKEFVAARDREIERLRQVHLQAVQDAGVEMIRGEAVFLDPHALEVDDRKVTADKILIAVGGKAIKPEIPGMEYAITSRGMFDVEELPQRLAIIGGGYIGVEFASILRSLGSEVTILDTSEQILSGFDDDLRDMVSEGLQQHGIRFLGNTTLQEIQHTPAGLILKLEGADSIAADTVLCATGRSPDLSSLNLEQAGIELDGKAIAVNEQSQTSQPNIYAVGDCTNRLQLTPVAREEGLAFADTVFGQRPRSIDYDRVPSAVFSRPEAASVGLTEAQAREQFGDAVKCYREKFHPLSYSLIKQDEQALIKLVVDGDDRLLGIHMVGESAAEIVQSMGIALKLKARKQDLTDLIGIHPTIAEEFFSLFDS